jgi:hypothetical protein
MKKAPDLFPLALTLCLVAWTAAVYKHAGYGTWHVYPALAWAPAVLISHVAVIIRTPSRARHVLYAIAHLALAVPLWIGCLMLISKDSL